MIVPAALFVFFSSLASDDFGFFKISQCVVFFSYVENGSELSRDSFASNKWSLDSLFLATYLMLWNNEMTMLDCEQW